MNTHTIKSKYNFILHLDLLIHSAFILGHSIKLLVHLLYHTTLWFDGGALGLSNAACAPAFIATWLLPKMDAFADAPACWNCGTGTVGFADGVGVGFPPRLDRLDRLDRLLWSLRLDRLLWSLRLDRLLWSLRLDPPLTFMPDPLFTTAFWAAARCCDAAITLLPVAVETVAGMAAPPVEGTTVGLTTVAAYGLSVGFGVGFAIGCLIVW